MRNPERGGKPGLCAITRSSGTRGPDEILITFRGQNSRLVRIVLSLENFALAATAQMAEAEIEESWIGGKKP